MDKENNSISVENKPSPSHLAPPSRKKKGSASLVGSDDSGRSTKSSGSVLRRRLKSFLSWRNPKTKRADILEHDFMFDPESPFSLLPHRSELLSKLSHLIKSQEVNSHLPFANPPRHLPDAEQSATASSLLQHGLAFQEKEQHEAALMNVSTAAELGVPLALYWLAISSRYGWSKAINRLESFSCFVYAAYLSVLASIQQEQQPCKGKGHRRTQTLMNESIKLALQANRPSHASVLGHRRSATLNKSLKDEQEQQIPSMPPPPLPAPNPSGHQEQVAISLYDSNELALILCEIGACYEFGFGTLRSYEEAAYFYELSAGLGDADAAQEIGDCYRHGHGVKRDKWRAAAYYRLAEKRGMSLVNCTWIHKEKWGGTIRKSKSGDRKDS